MTKKDYFWPVIGLVAVAFSVHLLIDQLRDISYEDVLDSLNAISLHGWLMSALATVAAYVALAGYDRLALSHLRKKVSWRFISVASFVAYAIGHNLGASVFSGAVVRYRAYRSQGLTPAEVGILVAFCSFTFVLGTILLGGMALLIEPTLPSHFHKDLPQWLAQALGAAMMFVVVLYLYGSLMKRRSIALWKIRLEYPRFSLICRQLIVAPLELLAAAAIIYYALPEQSNPGYFMVLGIFLASFSAALLSHAPGGLGVLEVMFLLALPEVNPADVIAALLVFRLFYLIIPFAISLIFVVWFEQDQLLKKFKGSKTES
ncbi:lysylphosphatidylglycerol synthase domain-containing protein [Rheinheimera sp.]|uniref:lysylphosphatidylglycerol synthase domain-containing protein n=1 Tax=Rheinheimera sp. TaxID=1869214 RepID=UPI00307EE47F